MPGLLDRLRAFFRPPAAPSAAPPQPLRLVDDADWSERLDPLDAARAQVYGDWLEEQGDGRAQLLRLAGTPAFDDFVRAHVPQLFGAFGRHVTQPHAAGYRSELELQWRHGVLEGVSLRSEQCVDELAALVMLPVCNHLAHVAVGPPPPGRADPKAVRDFTALAHLPRLRSLFLGDFEYPDECEMSWCENGSLETLWPTLPRLTTLKVRGLVNEWGAIESNALTRLTWETSGHTRANLQRFITAKLPALTHLELWFGDANYGAEVTVEDLGPLLARRLPLEGLGLCNFEFADELVESLVRAPLFAQVKHLNLSGGCLTDAGVETLLRHRERLTHLDSLDVSENLLSAAAVSALSALEPAVTATAQRKADDGDRYVSVTE